RKLIRGTEKQTIVPADRQNYLSEIVATVRSYKKRTEELAAKARQLRSLKEVVELEPTLAPKLEEKAKKIEGQFQGDELALLKSYDKLKDSFSGPEYTYQVRGREIRQPLVTESLSH